MAITDLFIEILYPCIYFKNCIQFFYFIYYHDLYIFTLSY